MVLKETSWEPAERAAVAALLAVATALRAYDLNAQLWFDEISTLITAVRGPLIDIVTHFPSNNDHVFYSVLANLSIAAFGEHPWSLRLPAAIFGVASIYMLYVLGRETTGRFEAFVAAMLATLAYHHVWFSQNARGYTFLLLAILLSTHLLLRGLQHRRRSDYLVFAIVTAIAAYTHLTMLFAAVGQALVVAAHLLIVRRGRFVLGDWINPALGFGLAALLTLLLYAPLLGDIQAFFLAEPRGRNIATFNWAVWETLRRLHLDARMWWALAIGGAIALTGFVSYLRQSPTLAALFVAPGFMVAAATILLQRPTFPRFFFFVAGFAILIVVRGVMVWGRMAARRLPAGERWVPIAAAGAMAGVAIAMLPAAYRLPKQDYVGALTYVESQARPGEKVGLAGIGATVVYRDYYLRTWPHLRTTADLARARAAHPAVWVIYSLPSNMRTNEADLLAAITNSCPSPKTFWGTLADGEVIVSRCPRQP